MGTTDRFSPDEVQRILEVTSQQLDYWDRLRLVSAQRDNQTRFYDFRDLIGLRTVKQLLAKGVPASRLGRTLTALRKQLSHIQAPLSELRVLSNGKDVVVERDGARLEPLSGQFVMNFDTRELQEKVRVISERTADQWIALALDCEAASANTKNWMEAIEAYESALRVDPRRVDALLNCGTLYYEQGNFEKALACFQRAVDADPQDTMAHANLGSTLEEVGEAEQARQHLRIAVRLNPDYPDARYNLALVCEKLGAYGEAREHWKSYLQFDSSGPWSDYARQRLSSSLSAKSGV
ncbi:MAG TPA: tetratricopeptide repeat protein [Candidatus Dormibacteraeota bacterium]|jgi:tetratricopeptide (TPR) repeat protein|nr:tetratricopeptide repeat protein [Candidatus Dormibacteraeota bacterium]